MILVLLPPPPQHCCYYQLPHLSSPPPPPPKKKKGLFLAPTIVGESIKGAFLLAEVFGRTFGLPTNPPPPITLIVPVASGSDAIRLAPAQIGARAGGGGGGGGGVGGRTDIVQAVELGDRDRLMKFCEAVQLLSPVNAYVRPGE